MNEKHVCCICGKEFIGFGNNPYPLKEEGLCCNKCNEKVIEARIVMLYSKGSEQDAKDKI